MRETKLGENWGIRFSAVLVWYMQFLYYVGRHDIKTFGPQEVSRKWAVAKRSVLKISKRSRIRSNLLSAWSTGKGNRREAKKM